MGMQHFAPVADPFGQLKLGIYVSVVESHVADEQSPPRSVQELSDVENIPILPVNIANSTTRTRSAITAIIITLTESSAPFLFFIQSTSLFYSFYLTFIYYD
jgi:hypothetical protein